MVTIFTTISSSPAVVVADYILWCRKQPGFLILVTWWCRQNDTNKLKRYRSLLNA